MTDTIINEKAVTLQMNMRGLRQFGEAIGVDTPTEAGAKIAEISSTKDGITFKTFDIFANLIFVMAQRGKPNDLTLDDCYEAINDLVAIQAMLKELEMFLPSQDIVKKKEAEAVKV